VIDWLREPFEPAFMQRALLAGTLVALITAMVGTWVVLRGLTFMGDALAHGVLPGLAVASVAGFDLTLGAAAGSAVMIGGIHLVHRRARLAEDVGIGLLFVGMLALGVVIISRSPSFTGDLTGLLFGDALGVDAADLRLEAAAAVLALAGVVFFYRPFLVLAFNEDKAAVLGLRPRLAHVAMLALVAIAVVASFRAVGTMLVFGLLVAPPATATLIVRRVPTMMATAAALGVVSVVAGLVLSYRLDTAAGATMAGTSVALFFVVLTVQEIRLRFRRPDVAG
jgi:ABC-type Mn2+/Zn2+ transport system permease subunit